tara:strand:- start:155 stop:1060 length:906 start_codon:yes stop_codon:yes gene_type:complete
MSTPENPSETLEDIELIPPSEAFTYKDQVCEIVETLTLDSDKKQNRTKQSILKNRYLSEVLNYEKRRDNTKKYYNVFRFLVTTGSIMLPAIMSIGQMDPAKLPANFDNISYWTSFMISLTVTISNGFLQLFSLDKNYFEFALTAEQLKTEGWQFFQLSGKYEIYDTHEEAYKPFSKSVETIKRKQVEKEFQGKGDVNKNKKDKDKDKEKDEPKSDPKMDLIMGLLGQGGSVFQQAGQQAGQQADQGLRETVGGVRDILKQSIPGTKDGSSDIESGSSVTPVSASEKEKANQELLGLIRDDQ